MIHQALVALKYNALFPAPLVASSLVLLLNLSLARALGKEGSFSIRKVLLQECRPLVPWFVGLAYLASLVRSAATLNGMNAGLVTLPMLFALDSAFRAWFNTKEKHREELAALQKRSLENLAALHQRTLETLAVAINGRDRTTQMHLRRVQFYVRAVGAELKLSDEQLEHLNVAALLHDIGKLGIPDHILLKPGPLSPEEWEKMKTHPLSGAEMLARMNFPEQVLEIVATHHEKWDGKGYPRGLKGGADSDRLANSFRGGLPGCARIGPSLPQRSHHRYGDGQSLQGRGTEASIRRWSPCCNGAMRSWSAWPGAK